jgi:hypothetical protein
MTQCQNADCADPGATTCSACQADYCERHGAHPDHVGPILH